MRKRKGHTTTKIIEVHSARDELVPANTGETVVIHKVTKVE